MTAPAHPAKFSDPILEWVRYYLVGQFPGYQRIRCLDPFAGVGKVHALRWGGIRTVGVEIEEEWARQSPFNIVGDSTSLPFPDGVFQLMVTSPTYGNRMADHYVPMERCSLCAGTGREFGHQFLTEPCKRCQGKGFNEYKRHTYRQYLGRDLHPHNTGRMQWGKKYRALHMAVWRECRRVMAPGAVAIVNVSNHIRAGKEVNVARWHRDYFRHIGFQIVRDESISTARLKHGANYDTRVDGERILVMTRT